MGRRLIWCWMVLRGGKEFGILVRMGDSSKS